MMTSSNGNIFHVAGPLCGEFTGDQLITTLTKASDAELWRYIWSVLWINSWVNNREAGDFRRHRAHYDVIVTKYRLFYNTYVNIMKKYLRSWHSSLKQFTITTESRIPHRKNIFAAPSVLENASERFEEDPPGSENTLLLQNSFKIWWRHQMKTFSASLAFCAGNSPVTGEIPSQRPVTQSFDVFLDLRLNKRLSKYTWGWWFETPSRPLWRHCNDWFNVADAVGRAPTYDVPIGCLFWIEMPF